MAIPTREQITGLILAGGRGTRMDARDKGLEDLAGRPMFAHALERLQPQVATIVISANRHRDRYGASACRVVADRSDDYPGPLAGLQAGLAACETGFLMCVPCDAPFFPRDLVPRLASVLDDDAIDAVVARTVERVHPVFCLMRTTVRADVDAFLEAGGRSVHAWVGRLRHRAVSFGDEASFRNLNTAEELRHAQADVHQVR